MSLSKAATVLLDHLLWNLNAPSEAVQLLDHSLKDLALEISLGFLPLIPAPTPGILGDTNAGVAKTNFTFSLNLAHSNLSCIAVLGSGLLVTSTR